MNNTTISTLANLFSENGFTSIDQTITIKEAINIFAKFLESKDNLTEVEKLAVYMYQNDTKLTAVKYLMQETKRGLKESKEFLDYHSKLNHEQ